MQSLVFLAIGPVIQAFIRNLPSGFTTAVGSIEARYGQNAVPVGFKRRQRSFQPQPEGANYSRGNDCYPVSRCFSVQIVKSRHLPASSPRDFDCFPNRSTLPMSPKGENSSSEVRQLSLRRCSAAI